MKSFDMNFLPKTTDILPKHDLVFGSPINDPIAGIPLGDGDRGSLLWFEQDGIHVNLNKTDLWDLSTQESDHICSNEEENLTCLRHGGELTVKFADPCFDMIYQRNFEARLSLADATARFSSETAFSKITGEVFASAKYGTGVMRLFFDLAESEPVEICLQRYGSRNFWRWYSQMTYKPDEGLDGTQTELGENTIFITHSLNGTDFCLGLGIDYSGNKTPKRINRHSGKFGIETDCGELTLFWTISVGNGVEDAKAKAQEALLQAMAAGWDAVFCEHKQAWESFWNRSLVRIPNDYIENCFYLSLYYSNSSCRGKYPPLFTNGIWGFRHDYYPWCYYFHYNMQHMFAPLEPSGHGELTHGYYEMRKNGLEAAKSYAQKMKNCNGAFYHDVTDFLGRGAGYDSDNFTPGSQIAMAMFKHYKMWGDESFLKETALPVMREVAEFYLSVLAKEEDGLYHIHNTTAYEGTPLYNDTITDLVMIRSLFGALAELVPEEAEKYADVANNLPKINTVPMLEEESENGVFAFGIGKGSKVFGAGEVISIGKDSAGLVRKNFGDLSKCFYGFPDTEMSPLYPSGVFGLRDKGTPLFDAMMNQIMLHPTPELCMQWCMMPIYMARMGMADRLYEFIESVLSAWQTFPCGLGADCPVGISDVGERLHYNNVTILEKGTQTQAEGFGFRHFDMEALPIVAFAVCEALLQSYDGVLRICPATRGKTEFCLYAEGGFKVSARLGENSAKISVQNTRESVCRLVLPPWVEEMGMSLCLNRCGKIIEISPAWESFKGERVLLLSDLAAGDEVFIISGEDIRGYESSAEPNKTWKTCGKAHLGTPPIPGM